MASMRKRVATALQGHARRVKGHVTVRLVQSAKGPGRVLAGEGQEVWSPPSCVRSEQVSKYSEKV